MFVAAVAAAAGVAFAGITFPAGSGHDAPATGSTRMISVTMNYGPLTITGPDPFVEGAAFGWLPSGVVYYEDYIAPNGGLMAAAMAPVNGAKAPPSFLLESYSDKEHAENGIGGEAVNMPGFMYAGKQLFPVTESPTAPINGAPAHSITSSAFVPGNEAMLFRLPDGRWADAVGEALGSDGQSVLHHMAETVTVSSRPISLPVTIGGLPKGTSPHSYSNTGPVRCPFCSSCGSTAQPSKSKWTGQEWRKTPDGPRSARRRTPSRYADSVRRLAALRPRWPARPPRSRDADDAGPLNIDDRRLPGRLTGFGTPTPCRT